MVSMNIRSDGSEKVDYSFDNYYAYIRPGLLSRYPNFSADSHWHDDLEFIRIISGSMDYNVNGEIVRLDAGNGILVNARQLHYGFSSAKEECEFICVLLHPMLLCALPCIERDFISPILSNEAVPYILLDRNVGWHREVLNDIAEIYAARDKKAAQLYIQSAFYHIWILLTENIKSETHSAQDGDRRLSVLKNMLSFIQKNYAEKVTLGDIAAAGNVSKSSCLAIFKKYLMDTPINHLTACRLKHASDLLKETDMSVSEIALSTGFQGASYFSEVFRRIYNETPSEYRKENDPPC